MTATPEAPVTDTDYADRLAGELWAALARRRRRRQRIGSTAALLAAAAVTSVLALGPADEGVAVARFDGVVAVELDGDLDDILDALAREGLDVTRTPVAAPDDLRGEVLATSSRDVRFAGARTLLIPTDVGTVTLYVGHRRGDGEAAYDLLGQRGHLADADLAGEPASVVDEALAGAGYHTAWRHHPAAEAHGDILEVTASADPPEDTYAAGAYLVGGGRTVIGVAVDDPDAAAPPSPTAPDLEDLP